jgi:hypothetical protein
LLWRLGKAVEKPPSKADIRDQLEREMARFLREGGSVQKIPRGQSGREPGEKPPQATRGLFSEPPATRTLVPEVVAAIEERRRALLKRTPQPKRKRRPEPRRKTIYDDFGEPLRRVWVED